MDNIKKNIISTLSLYKMLGVPALTAFEIYRHLGNAEHETQNAKLSDVYNSLIENPEIKHQNGFYWLDEKNDSDQKITLSQRISGSKIAIQKIKIAKRVAKILHYAPFIKCIAISGSVSRQTPEPASDIDFFIIASRGRIWIVRLCTVAITHILGKRRHKNLIRDRICLNAYISDEQSHYPVQDATTAQMIARILPLYGKGVFFDFLRSNSQWMKIYISNFTENILPAKNTILPSVALPKHLVLKKMVNFLETSLENFFSKRILRKTPLARPPSLTVNKNALLFHYPNHKYKDISEKYTQALAQATKHGQNPTT